MPDRRQGQGLAPPLRFALRPLDRFSGNAVPVFLWCSRQKNMVGERGKSRGCIAPIHRREVRTRLQILMKVPDYIPQLAIKSRAPEARQGSAALSLKRATLEVPLLERSVHEDLCGIKDSVCRS